MKKVLHTITQRIDNNYSFVSSQATVVLLGHYLTDFRRRMNDYFKDNCGKVAQCENHIGVVDLAMVNGNFMDVWDDTYQILILKILGM